MSAGLNQEPEAVRSRGPLRDAEPVDGAARDAEPVDGAAPKAASRPSRWARVLRPAAALVLVAATCFAVGGSLRAAGTELADAAGGPGERSC
ncbi:hypothetical protein SBADM41S_09330 [Streptomyces badius]